MVLRCKRRGRRFLLLSGSLVRRPDGFLVNHSFVLPFILRGHVISLRYEVGALAVVIQQLFSGRTKSFFPGCHKDSGKGGSCGSDNSVLPVNPSHDQNSQQLSMVAGSAVAYFSARRLGNQSVG